MPQIWKNIKQWKTVIIHIHDSVQCATSNTSNMATAWNEYYIVPHSSDLHKNHIDRTIFDVFFAFSSSGKPF